MRHRHGRGATARRVAVDSAIPRERDGGVDLYGQRLNGQFFEPSPTADSFPPATCSPHSRQRQSSVRKVPRSCNKYSLSIGPCVWTALCPPGFSSPTCDGPRCCCVLLHKWLPRCLDTRICWADVRTRVQSASTRTVMILPQVHLRKPCYDFYFL